MLPAGIQQLGLNMQEQENLNVPVRNELTFMYIIMLRVLELRLK